MAIVVSSPYTTPQQICNSLLNITAVFAAVTSPAAKTVTAFSFMSANALTCCLVNSVLRPTKLVSGKSLHSSSEKRIDGCNTRLHVSNASGRGIQRNVVTFCITKSLNDVKLLGTTGDSTRRASVHASAGVCEIGVPVNSHSHGWCLAIHLANIL